MRLLLFFGTVIVIMSGVVQSVAEDGWRVMDIMAAVLIFFLVCLVAGAIYAPFKIDEE